MFLVRIIKFFGNVRYILGIIMIVIICENKIKWMKYRFMLCIYLNKIDYCGGVIYIMLKI